MAAPIGSPTPNEWLNSEDSKAWWLARQEWDAAMLGTAVKIAASVKALATATIFLTIIADPLR